MKTRSLFFHYLRGSTIFLLLTIAVTSGISYLFAEDILVSTVKDGLQYHADFRKERILTQFAEQKQWMEEVSQDAGLLEFAENLFDSFEVSGLKSASYQGMQKRFRNEYQGLLSSQGIEDLFLINPDRELIFSLRPMESEIGEKMGGDGFYGETIFSQLIEEVITKKSFAVSHYGKIEQVESSTVLMGISLPLSPFNLLHRFNPLH
ncbi:MAG: hypothetical protein HN421_08950, partial [Gammaproteobacteria bacterium]|nr:hypothetical protein [Gammaproteobacteria bacterium]